MPLLGRTIKAPNEAGLTMRAVHVGAPNPADAEDFIVCALQLNGTRRNVGGDSQTITYPAARRSWQFNPYQRGCCLPRPNGGRVTQTRARICSIAASVPPVL